MSSIKKSTLYPIEPYLMTQNWAYSKGRRIIPKGIQVHSVGCKGTTRERWRRWNSPAYSKCPNAFIDTGGIMQTLPWDQRPWLSGRGTNGNANDSYIGFEICEPATAKDTPEAAAYLYGCVRWLCTELCREYGIEADNIRCHAELHKMGLASNHADVNHWWGKKGTSWEPYTMDRLREDVRRALAGDRAYQEAIRMSGYQTIKKGAGGELVRKLQSWLTAAGYIVTADGSFGAKTQAAVMTFQKANGLTADGIVGPRTWEALEEAVKAIPGETVADDDGAPDAPTAERLAALETLLAELGERIRRLEERLPPSLEQEGGD